MTLTVRRIGMWSLWLVLGVLTVIAIYLLILAFPTPLFAYKASFGDYRVYSDEPIAADLGQVIEEAAWRVRAMEPQSDRSGVRVYLCNSLKRYAFFAFLTRMNPDSLAIHLSVANEMFVSIQRVDRFRATNRGLLRHTRFEGNLAEVIAHEMAHFKSIDALGYRSHLAQPVWKSEGWAEYQANVASIREDPSYDLAERVDLLLDDRQWGGSPARDMWEWQLLVEYLGQVHGYGLDDLIQDQVTKSSTRTLMLAWHRSRRDTTPGRVPTQAD